jgi:cysteinyl-tRNA synthetase
MGMTDVDDKIIKRAAEVGRPFTDIARAFEREFVEDLRALNVRENVGDF